MPESKETKTVLIQEVPISLWNKVRAIAATEGKKVPFKAIELIKKGLEDA